MPSTKRYIDTDKHYTLLSKEPTLNPMGTILTWVPPLSEHLFKSRSKAKINLDEDKNLDPVEREQLRLKLSQLSERVHQHATEHNAGANQAARACAHQEALKEGKLSPNKAYKFNFAAITTKAKLNSKGATDNTNSLPKSKTRPFANRYLRSEQYLQNIKQEIQHTSSSAGSKLKAKIFSSPVNPNACGASACASASAQLCHGTEPTALDPRDKLVVRKERTLVQEYMERIIMMTMTLLLFLAISIHSIKDAKADEALNDLLSLSEVASNLSSEDRQILLALQQASNPKSTKSQVSRAQVSSGNQVRFVYGAARPTLVCSLLHVCDIALQANEVVVDLKVGDSARWLIERSASGSPDGIIEHLAIKPTDVGLQSNLRIYTDKRTYDIDLKSSAQHFMPSVAFIYPEQALQNFAALKNNLQRRMNTQTIVTDEGGPAALIDKLDFAYEYSGDENLYPLRTFNDGRHTYLQMPPQVMARTLPALVVVHSTSLFANDDIAVTNYRIKGDKFVVDGIPEHLRLMWGNEDNGSAKSADIIYTPKA